MDAGVYFVLYPGKDSQRAVQNSETKEVELCLEGKVACQPQLKKGNALTRMGQGNYLTYKGAAVLLDISEGCCY